MQSIDNFNINLKDKFTVHFPKDLLYIA